MGPTLRTRPEASQNEPERWTVSAHSVRGTHDPVRGPDDSARRHFNVVVAINNGGRSHSARMSNTEEVMSKELTPEELEQQEGEQLPDREAMSLINANVAAPINAAVALNALSDDSVAIANAQQTADIDQSN
jgi:hypothetical protein